MRRNCLPTALAMTSIQVVFHKCGCLLVACMALPIAAVMYVDWHKLLVDLSISGALDADALAATLVTADAVASLCDGCKNMWQLLVASAGSPCGAAPFCR